MNDLSHLMQRLSQAFEPESAGRDGIGVPPVSDHFDLYHAPEEVRRQVPGKGGDPDRADHRALWLGGGGLMASALALSVGRQEAIFVLAGALMASASLCLGWHGVERLKAGRRRHAQRLERELAADRDWLAREKESVLASIHDRFGDIAVMRDPKGCILAANGVFCELAGVTDPVGRTLEELGFSFRASARADRVLAEIATVDGPRHFAWGDVVMRDPASGQLVTQSVGRDITEESRNALRAEEARVKAERASAAKSRLLATVAHEVRTPLTGLLGMADLLENSRLQADQRNYVAGLRQSGQTLSHLVEDLLDFATLEAGRFELRKVAESPRRLIEGVVEMLAPRAHFKGLEIASYVGPEVPEYLDLDPARLRQVLFNVAGNAVKFTRSGGVCVSATMMASDLVLVISDTGPGMTEEEQARIFEEFVQVGPADAKSGGKGLGLSITSRIVDAFHGGMSVASIKGVGTTFTIRIPVAAQAVHAAGSGRLGQLAGSAVLLLAPEGPAARAILRSIVALGGAACLCETPEALTTLLKAGALDGRPLTDVIIDHRLEHHFIGDIAVTAEMMRLRRVFLVNPEERQARISGPYDAWLIRPLREQSLVDVLRGRLHGLEKRSATNDNHKVRAPGGAATNRREASGLSILFGEDDPVNALLVRATLAKAGHSVRLAGDFDGLLDQMWSDGFSPDLLITDLGMPGGSGFEILAHIRSREIAEGRRPLPIIVLSGDCREETRLAALAAGANRVLAKPAAPEDLLQEVEAVIAGPRRLGQG